MRERERGEGRWWEGDKGGRQWREAGRKRERKSQRERERAHNVKMPEA